MSSANHLPVAGRVAWWGTAFLRGTVGADALLDVLLGEHVAHVVHARGVDGTPLLEALAAARSGGAEAVGAAFPGPGDPVGLGGPPAFTADAVDAGAAVLLLGPPGAWEPRGWVPTEVGRAVEWTSYDVARRVPPDLGDADRALRTAVRDAADALARLDVARWRPEVADHLHDLRTASPVTAPPGVPPRALDLAGRALHLGAVADLALADDGAAVSAGEIALRREAVLPLERAARHALTAACSPDGWPPG